MWRCAAMIKPQGRDTRLNDASCFDPWVSLGSTDNNGTMEREQFVSDAQRLLQEREQRFMTAVALVRLGLVPIACR